jgi:hypothetical protein
LVTLLSSFKDDGLFRGAKRIMSRMTSCRACGGIIAATAASCPRYGASFSRNSVCIMTVLLTALVIVTLAILSKR